jgi:hypothetical protein
MNTQEVDPDYNYCPYNTDNFVMLRIFVKYIKKSDNKLQESLYQVPDPY